MSEHLPRLPDPKASLSAQRASDTKRAETVPVTLPSLPGVYGPVVLEHPVVWDPGAGELRIGDTVIARRRR